MRVYISLAKKGCARHTCIYVMTRNGNARHISVLTRNGQVKLISVLTMNG